MLWYHDHALGINRLNVFAGLLGAFFVRDEFEDSLELPRGKYEIPLLIYDRVFDLEGQLNYPVSRRSEVAMGAGSFWRRHPDQWQTFSIYGSRAATVPIPCA